jgi:hypothetical protein
LRVATCLLVLVARASARVAYERVVDSESGIQPATAQESADLDCADFATQQEAPRRQPSFSFPLEDGRRAHLR